MTNDICDCAEALYAREFAHRSANMLQQAVAAVHLARRGGGLHLDAAATRLAAMAEVNRLLQGSDRPVDLGGVLEELATAVARSLEAGDRVSLSVSAPPLIVDAGRVRPLMMAVAELVANSIRHAFPEGRGTVRLEVRSDAARTRLLLEDDGTCGGWSRPGGQGRGIVDDLCERLGGTVRRSITPAGSSSVLVTMPRLAAAALATAGEA